MGFYPELDAIAAKAALPSTPEPGKGPARRASAPKAVRKTIALGAKGCDNCKLKSVWRNISSPRMATQRPPGGGGDILILGGAPNADGDIAGEPFKGRLNRMITDCLSGRDRDRLVYQNSVRCLPPEHTLPSHQDVHACSLHNDAEAAQHPIKYILGVGPIPLSHYWPGAQESRVNGVHFPVTIGGKPAWFFPVTDPAFVERYGGMKTAAGAVLRADMYRFNRERALWGKPKVEQISTKIVLYPKSLEEAQSYIDKMQEPVGIDIETEKLKPYMFGSRIITGAISDEKVCIAFPVDHPQGKTDWGLNLLLNTAKTKRWVAHNGAFELGWFLHYAGEETIFAQMDDSQALTRILFDRGTINSLEDVGMAILGVDIKGVTGVNAAHIMEYPLAEVLPYNGIDAVASVLIQRKLQDKVRGDNYKRLIASIITTAHAELRGVPIDSVYSNKIKREWTDNMEGLELKARGLYEVRQFEAAKRRLFRLSAPEDVGEALSVYGKLNLPSKVDARGKVTYTTDEEALKAAIGEGKNPLVDTVLSYRSAKRMLTTYIEPVQLVPSLYKDGLLHPNYTVMKTSTGRLSSEDINIQNWPKHDPEQLPVRGQIVPPKNHLIVAVDYAQLEARIIAMAAMDRVLIKHIISGYDIHTHWCKRTLHFYPEWMDILMDSIRTDDTKAAMKEGRQWAKNRFVFASFFGSGLSGVAKGMEIPEHVMRLIFEEFWDEFAGVAKWIKARRAEYNEYALSRTLTGRVRRGLLSGNEPINTPVQGTAADVVMDAYNAMRELSIEMKEPAFFPRINIHDDLTFFLPDSERMYEYMEIIGEVMTEVRYPWQVVPFAVEFSVGANWWELEEVGKMTGDYLRKQ